MNIFDIFTPKPASPAPTTPVAPVAATPTPAQPGNIDPNLDPNAPPATPAPAEPAPDAPLAEFADLWNTESKSAADPNAPTAPVPLNIEDVQKAVANANFSSGIKPETLAAITAGGEGANEALSEAMNQVAQQVMVQSLMASNKLQEKSMAEALATQAASLPEQIRNHAASSHLTDTNPLFNNPAVKPVIEAAKSALLQQYPTASPAEITKMTENYITTMGAAFAPTSTVNDNSALDTDWDAFMNTNQT